MNDKKDDKNLEKSLDQYLQGNQECAGDECIINTDKSLVERINKKIVTEDGRELLM